MCVDGRGVDKINSYNDNFMHPEAKSATIRRMQTNLEDWNEQLKDIMEKKERDGSYSYFNDHD